MISNQLNYPSIMLGFSTKYTLKSDGCAVACLGERLGYTIVQMNELLKERDCFAIYNGEKCIINWSKIPSAFPQVKKCFRVTSYDNNKVLEIINREGGCIVCVDYDGNERTVGDHFVVFKGNKTLEDPLGGKEKPTSTYTLTKGYVDMEVDGIIESDMTDDQKRALEVIETYKTEANHGNLEGAANAAVSAARESSNKDEQIKNLQNDIKTLDGQIEVLNAKVSELETKFVENQKVVLKQQKELATANENISELNQTISNITEEKNTWQTRYNNKNTEYNTLKSDYSELQAKYNSCNVSGQTEVSTLTKIIDFIKSLFKK